MTLLTSFPESLNIRCAVLTTEINTLMKSFLSQLLVVVTEEVKEWITVENV